MNIEEIKVPFPPQIKPEDILEKRRQNRKSAKSPNAFFIYRIAFLDQLRIHNFRVKMTDMSGLVSTAWKKEPLHVKAVYKDLARRVERLVIEARQIALAQRPFPQQQQQQQITQLPQTQQIRQLSTLPYYQYANNLNNYSNFSSLNYSQYLNNNPINYFHQPLVPSQNYSAINFEGNNHFINNNNSFSPTLSDDSNLSNLSNLSSSLFDSTHNINVEQPTYNYYHNYQPDNINFNDNTLY